MKFVFNILGISGSRQVWWFRSFNSF